MSKELNEKFKKLLCDFYCINDVDGEEEWHEHAYQYKVGNQIYLVCDEDGEEEILRDYRQCSIYAAQEDIPKIYWDFFDFNEYADYNWQTIYDVYEIVNEVIVEDQKYYICSL